MTHYWRIRKWLPERFGMPCRLLVTWSRNGNVLVEFEDGYRVVTSRWNVRRISVKRERVDPGIPPKDTKQPVGASLRDQLAIRFMDQLMAPMYARGISAGITAQMAKNYADNLIAVLKEEESAE